MPMLALVLLLLATNWFSLIRVFDIDNCVLDDSFLRMQKATAKQVMALLGVPAEKLYRTRSSATDAELQSRLFEAKLNQKVQEYIENIDENHSGETLWREHLDH